MLSPAMLRRSLLLSAVVVVGTTACGTPVDITPNPAALRFVDLPSAFVNPDDDVNPNADGFQGAVSVAVDNASTLSGTLELVVSGPNGDATTSVVSDDAVAVGLSLPSGPAPSGRESTITATLLVNGEAAEDVAAISQVVTVVDAEPVVVAEPLPAIELRIDTDGDVRVLVSAAEGSSVNARNLCAGGQVAVRFAPEGEAALARTRIKELVGGSAIYSFPFDEVGSYTITATLVGSTQIFGEVVASSSTQTVVP